MSRRLVPALVLLLAAGSLLAGGDPAGGAGSSAPPVITAHGDEVTVLGRSQNDEVRVLRQGSQPGDLLVQSIDGSNNPHTWFQVP